MPVNFPLFNPRWVPLEDIVVGPAGGRSIISLPRLGRYLKVMLTLGNSADADGNTAALSALAGQIEIQMNSQTLRSVTADRLDVINTNNGANYAHQNYNSAVAGAGRRDLTIFFEEPWRKNPVETDGLGWQTGWLADDKKFQIFVAHPAGITPVLEAQAFIDDFDLGEPHLISKWFTHEQPINAADFTKGDLPINSDVYQQISIFDTSDGKTVESVEITQNGALRYKGGKNKNTSHLKHYNMTPAAGMFNVVFDAPDRINAALPVQGRGNLIVKGTVSAAAAGTLTMVTQRLGDPSVA